MARAKNDEVDRICRLLVTSDAPLDKEQLTIYLENVTCVENLEGAVELSTDRLRALVSLEYPVNLEEVNARMTRKPNMKIQVSECPPVDKVLIRNLRKDVCDDEVTLYFEDRRNCPRGGDVVNVEVYNNMTAIVQFHDSSVAERVVKVVHPYLGSDVELRLWSPLDDVEDLKAAPASHSAAVVVGASVSKDAADAVIHYAKKQSELTQLTESLPESRRSERDESPYGLGKRTSSKAESQTDAQAAPSFPTPQQFASSTISDADNSRSKCLTIHADSEVQFCLLEQLLDNNFARERQCTFTADEHNWTITLTSRSEDSISVLAEELYSYKKGGTFEVGLSLSPELAQVLYDRQKQWLCRRLRDKVKEPAMLVMSSGSHLAVAAFSENVAGEAAKNLRACLLRGKVPLTDHQQKLLTAAKFRKKLSKLELVMNKAIVVKTGACEITVDGLPCDVISAVTEINQLLYKQL